MKPITKATKQALDYAAQIAEKYNNELIGTEHFLYGAMKVDCVASRYLREHGATSEQLVESVFMENKAYAGISPEPSPRLNNVLQLASTVSDQVGSTAITPDHIMFCIVMDQTSYAVMVLEQIMRIDTVDFRRELRAAISKGASTKSGDESGAPTAFLPPELNDLGIDLTARARENKLDPIIGRQDEINRTIEILCRKSKNNPVLIGEPGVGKSAIVEGLAQAIVKGNVPRPLQNKIVFQLDIASLMAGTKYRGVLEEKLKNAIQTIIENGNIITFIDELHTLAQSGAKEGEVSPADILKPYLARGELHTIGATTTDEYRKYIEADKALERRFQPITVEPPTVEQTVEIIKGLRQNYEAFHCVKLSDEAIEAAATLSDRYIQDRFLPDKAIDLIDEAMSCAKINNSSDPEEVKKLEEELNRVRASMSAAAAAEDFEAANKYQIEYRQIESKLKDSKLRAASDTEKNSPVVGSEEIASVVSKWTKIPITKLTESEKTRLVNLEGELHKRVIGQNDAVTGVAKAIRRARAGLKDSSRPIGSFMFLGPTGVGKTELCKALSEAMFDDENSVIRLDMSEYMEQYSVSKLIGSAPGYVGYDEGGQLTERVRRHPYSVVLFDEIEKAHPDVFNILLQILDDGRLTDSQGRMVSFKNTIIIMTSNVGANEVKSHSHLGFTPDEKTKNADEKDVRNDAFMNALKGSFRPEFLNRIDLVCVFDNLSKEDISRIANIMLERLEKSLSDRSITLAVTQNAIDYLVKTGYDPEYGARPLRRVIEQQVEDKIADAILSGNIADGAKIKIDSDGKQITISPIA